MRALACCQSTRRMLFYFSGTLLRPSQLPVCDGSCYMSVVRHGCHSRLITTALILEICTFVNKASSHATEMGYSEKQIQHCQGSGYAIGTGDNMVQVAEVFHCHICSCLTGIFSDPNLETPLLVTVPGSNQLTWTLQGHLMGTKLGMYTRYPSTTVQ